MHNVYVRDLVNICNGKLVMGNLDTPLIEFSKDTRTLKQNDVYIGIKGENFDGNTLYKGALEKGASGCILNKSVVLDKDFLKKYKDCFIVLVDDTIKSIQDLASYKRDLYDIPVIGITGSVGKTSTKDIVRSVLSQKYNVLATQGNYNNHIGVPLTILSLKDHNCLIVEMGMSNLGEISVLSKIAKPTVAVITNVGTAHIGNLGSRENILKAKLEILDGMNKNGVLVINNDNDLLHEYYLKCGNTSNIITYGIINDSNYMAKSIISEKDYSVYDVLLNDNNYTFKINVPGTHFVLNSLCGISVGKIFNISEKDIQIGLENFTLTKRRMEIKNIKGITIINDSYNANLDSMNSAINYLGSLDNRKIAVLGDMLELGSFSERLHRNLASTILNNKIDIVITVGNLSKYIKDELNKNNFNNVYSYDDNNSALNKLKEIVKENDNILIKASNSMNFMEIYNGLENIIK